MNRELTASSDEAARAWDRAVLGLLSHSRETADRLRVVLELDPDHALAHCLRGFGMRTLARRDLVPSATEHLGRAHRSLRLRGGTEREHRIAAALGAWCQGDSARAAHELTSILERDPCDVLVLKLDHACRFMRGDARGMRENAERAIAAPSIGAPGYGYALGMLAFAREETGDYEGAERAAREALEHAEDDAWGAHALAHVHLMRDRAEEGRAWLERCVEKRTFAHCNNFGGHIAWHLAIFHVELGAGGRALALYDDILAYPAGDFREVSNAAALLYRLEEEGVAVGSRWDALADRVLPYAHDHGYAFADAHYALTLMRAGRADDARALLSSLRRYAVAAVSRDARVQRDVGLSLVTGIIALEEGRAKHAFEALGCAEDGASRVGGSHAQRDLFRRLWLSAARRTGEAAHVARALDAYLAIRPESAWANAERREGVRCPVPAE